MTDLLLITFDALRFDVAEATLRDGRTPFLRSLLPGGWEPRHSPGNFTYAAHSAIFAGFWPTSVTPGRHTRPFALSFPGSRTVGPSTTLLEGDNIVIGLQRMGYRTICIGGVGFFNKRSSLGSVLPSFFEESHWHPTFSVLEFHAPRAQVRAACTRLDDCPREQPLFLFINVSATHPPTNFYLPNTRRDSVATQSAALEYVDQQLSTLFDALRDRGRGGRAYLMSDHGTLFGEKGFTGHRVGHPAVWTVPYAEYTWEAAP